MPYTKIPNVRYGEETRNLMDIYYPNIKEKRTSYGSILLLHGGYWMYGDKHEMEMISIKYAKKGYVCGSMIYRYVNDTITFKHQLADMEQAIKKLSQHSEAQGYPLNGIGFIGSSAGAHLSAMFSYSIPGESIIPIKFVVLLSAPADFHKECFEGSVIGMTGPELALLANADKRKPEEIPEKELEEIILNTSPANFVTNSSVPSIVGYGLKDNIVPDGNRISMKKKYEQTTIQYDFIEFPNSGHGLEGDNDILRNLFKKMDSYCEQFFGY